MNTNTPPKNFYQSQPPMPGYPYNYMPPNNENQNGQAYNPAYQYWNYYQYPQSNPNFYQHQQPYSNAQNQWPRDQRNNYNNHHGNRNFNNRNNNFQVRKVLLYTS